MAEMRSWVKAGTMNEQTVRNQKSDVWSERCANRGLNERTNECRDGMNRLVKNIRRNWLRMREEIIG